MFLTRSKVQVCCTWAFMYLCGVIAVFRTENQTNFNILTRTAGADLRSQGVSRTPSLVSLLGRIWHRCCLIILPISNFTSRESAHTDHGYQITCFLWNIFWLVLRSDGTAGKWNIRGRAKTGRLTGKFYSFRKRLVMGIREKGERLSSWSIHSRRQCKNSNNGSLKAFDVVAFSLALTVSGLMSALLYKKKSFENSFSWAWSNHIM